MRIKSMTPGFIVMSTLLMILISQSDSSNRFKRNSSLIQVVSAEAEQWRDHLGAVEQPAASIWKQLFHGCPAVAVVDLGDGAAWLKALHSHHALSSLVLWRPLEMIHMSPPQWLERQCGYLLAASSFTRIQSFLDDDTQDAIEDPAFIGLNEAGRRSLQLSSSAFSVLSARGRPSASPGKGRRKAARRLVKHGQKALEYLWKYHQSFKGIAVLCPNAGYDCGALIHFTVGSDFIQRQWASVERTMEAATWLARLLTRDLQGHPVRVIWYSFSPRLLARKLVVHDRTWSLTGDEVFLLLNILGRMHTTLDFYEEDNQEEMSTFSSATRTLVLGNADVMFGHFSAIDEFSTGTNIIAATAEFNKGVTLVSLATELPAWSLPLRVFSPRIWLALLGAAVAYALAWRVVAGESLAASAAAALRAFSSCGGAPQDRVRATPQRLQLAAALLASAVVVAAAYQSHLAALAARRDVAAETNSFAQLAAAGRPLVCGTTALVRRARERAPGLRARKLALHQIEALVAWAEAARAPVAALVHEEGWLYDLAAPGEEAGLRMMTETMDLLPAFVHARRNWPWTATFNAIALRMHAAGLVAHWRASFARDFAWWRRVVLRLRYAAAARARGSRRREGAAPRPLALGDLPAHLALLAAGLAAAGLAFAAEGWRRHRGDVLLWGRRRAAQLVGCVQRPWRMLSQAVMRRLYRLDDLLDE